MCFLLVIRKIEVLMCKIMCLSLYFVNVCMMLGLEIVTFAIKFDS